MLDRDFLLDGSDTYNPNWNLKMDINNSLQKIHNATRYIIEHAIDPTQPQDAYATNRKELDFQILGYIEENLWNISIYLKKINNIFLANLILGFTCEDLTRFYEYLYALRSQILEISELRFIKGRNKLLDEALADIYKVSGKVARRICDELGLKPTEG